jgi:hypothetical protein
MDSAGNRDALSNLSGPIIADELNAAGAVTASGHPISPQLVAQKQGRRGLRLKDERRRARQIIRQGLIEALPAVLPAEQDKQRVLALTDHELGEGNTWKMIAITLNAAGLRPPRGRTFTPVGVRLLYLRAHRLRSFKLRSTRSDNPGADR